MALTILLTPTRAGTGLVSIAMGLVRALESRGIKVGFLNPISNENNHNRETMLVTDSANADLSMSLSTVDKLMGSGQTSTFLEKITAMHQLLTKDNDITRLSSF